MATMHPKQVEERLAEERARVTAMMHSWPADFRHALPAALAELMRGAGINAAYAEETAAGLDAAVRRMIAALDQTWRHQQAAEHILNRAQADIVRAENERRGSGFRVN